MHGENLKKKKDTEKSEFTVFLYKQQVA